MDVVASGESPLRVIRAGDNLWWAAFGAPRALGVADLRSPTTNPSAVLAALDERLAGSHAGSPTEVTLAKVELDVCGAWVTVANGEAPRPVVLRRAGWADLRGHPSAPLGGAVRYQPADDRVGLGPGDALVLARGASPGEPSPEGDEARLDRLLRFAGESPSAVHEAVAASSAGPVTVIGVPHDLGDDPKRRVAEAIGVPHQDLDLPGYPLGDLQPELWHEPPPPPRLARLSLGRDPAGPRVVRQLLDRLLASWRLEGRVDDDGLRLAASELATNAVRHAEPLAATIRYLGSSVRIEVDDASPVLPAFREPDETGGRGLPLVDSVAAAWGTERHPDGKRVWCEVAVDR